VALTCHRSRPAVAERQTDDAMDVSENAVHSFVIRLWCEERDDDAPFGIWRGHLTHVPSRQRRYIRDLDEIVTIITEYLRDPDGPPTPG